MHFCCQSNGYTGCCLINPLQIFAEVNTSICESSRKLSALGVHTSMESGIFSSQLQLFQLILFILDADNLCTVLLSRSNAWIVIWSVWQELCKAQGNSIKQNSKKLLPALKSLEQAIVRRHLDLADTCSSNEYKLQYLCSTSTAK
jgi:hypothetical protein